MDIFTLERGTAPLLISLPHDGSHIPDAIAARMQPAARRSPDTDWHVGKLYEPLARELGASVLRPQASRYVVDLNRPADGHALYPGRRETGLVSTIGFDGQPLYLEARSRTPTRSRSACPTGGSLITARWPKRSSGYACSMAMWCCGKVIPSAVMCRCCSKAACRTSTWAPPTAAVVAPTCSGDSPTCWNRRRTTISWSTAASRAASSPGVSASPGKACRRSSWSCPSTATWTRTALPGTTPRRRRCRR
ncbi:N-formylglutamate amidohydrolase [Rhodanobacter sp. 115]|nr:N-formylglutamate amidohydrolase [Rhodanobacter sp. 115]